MGINWFEGGRRLTSLVAIAILLGAIGYLIFGGGENRIILESIAPNDRLHWSLGDCAPSDLSEDWSGMTEFTPGQARGMTACFRAGKNGQIPIGIGAKHTFSINVRGKDIPVSYSDLIYAESYTPEAHAYAVARMNEFRFSSNEMETIREGQWKIGVLHWCQRASDAFPWLAGALLVLWLLVFALGWLVRGFAGIPSGRDFRIDANERNTGAGRASLDWFGTAVASWAALAGLAWIIRRVLMPTPSQLAPLASKILGGVGVIVFVGLALGFFIGGSVAFRSLFYRVIGRPIPATKQAERQLLAFGITNVGVVVFSCWILGNYTVVGDWFDVVDQWGRANGMEDGLSVSLCAFCLLWPYIPLHALNQFAKMHARRLPDEV